MLLAAGSSSRLGKAKQLLECQGKTLLQHSMEAALKSNADKVVVVLGANAESLTPTIQQYNIYIAVNTEWSEGIASSIRKGVQVMLQSDPEINNIILMVCDQPFITTILLNELMTDDKGNKNIVASNYGGTLGTPALFNKIYFPELLSLSNNEGAKKIIQKYSNKVVAIQFSKGDIDIDTMQDYEDLLQEFSPESL